MSSSRRFLAVCALVLCMGCAHYQWVQTTGEVTVQRLGLTLTTPVGWYQLKLPASIALTRDGSSIDRIVLFLVDKGDTIPGTIAVVHKKLLLHELPTTIVSGYRAAESVYDVVTDSVTLTRVDGIPAARMGYSYKDRSGVPMRSILVCFPYRSGYAIIESSAVQGQYHACAERAMREVVLGLRRDGRGK